MVAYRSELRLDNCNAGRHFYINHFNKMVLILGWSIFDGSLSDTARYDNI